MNPLKTAVATCVEKQGTSSRFEQMHTRIMIGGNERCGCLALALGDLAESQTAMAADDQTDAEVFGPCRRAHAQVPHSAWRAAP